MSNILDKIASLCGIDEASTGSEGVAIYGATTNTNYPVGRLDFGSIDHRDQPRYAIWWDGGFHGGSTGCYLSDEAADGDVLAMIARAQKIYSRIVLTDRAIAKLKADGLYDGVAAVQIKSLSESAEHAVLSGWVEWGADPNLEIPGAYLDYGIVDGLGQVFELSTRANAIDGNVRSLRLTTGTDGHKLVALAKRRHSFVIITPRAMAAMRTLPVVSERRLSEKVAGIGGKYKARKVGKFGAKSLVSEDCDVVHRIDALAERADRPLNSDEISFGDFTYTVKKLSDIVGGDFWSAFRAWRRKNPSISNKDVAFEKFMQDITGDASFRTYESVAESRNVSMPNGVKVYEVDIATDIAQAADVLMNGKPEITTGGGTRKRIDVEDMLDRVYVGSLSLDKFVNTVIYGGRSGSIQTKRGLMNAKQLRAFVAGVLESNHKPSGYRGLNDAGRVCPDLSEGVTEVWFARNPGDAPGDSISETHVKIGTVKCASPHRLYTVLQESRWCPRGEADRFLSKLGIQRRSMRTGDVIVTDGRRYLLERSGFRRLEAQA